MAEKPTKAIDLFVGFGRARRGERGVVSDECPGNGSCHGPVVWCEWCGDTSQMCDARDCGAPCDCHPLFPPLWQLEAELQSANAEAERARRVAHEAEDTVSRARERLEAAKVVAVVEGLRPREPGELAEGSVVP